jgi:CDGSH-type Zn-finger protein
MKVDMLTPVYVKYMPEILEDGKLYISDEFKTSIHKCCCGCGISTVMPWCDGGWTLTDVDGYVTFHPSVGNMQFPCKSHYWIVDNSVQWC